MDAERLARTHLQAMATGDIDLAIAAVHPEHINHMAADHPAASALRGIPGFMATSAYLRHAFAELRFDIIDIVTDGYRTVAHVTMTGRQDGPFVVFPPRKKPVAFPATHKHFAVRQCHIFTIRDGLQADHIAVRDDLGMMTQLGHLPPSATVAARMFEFHASGGARRAVKEALRIAQQAADDAADRLEPRTAALGTLTPSTATPSRNTSHIKDTIFTPQ